MIYETTREQWLCKEQIMKEEIERGFTFGGIVGLSGILHHGCCSANSSGMNTGLWEGG